ncbi:dTDP-glucose 4,6-dehydratase [Nitrosopumilus maritimus]|uniref:dTDP-glucose 4,6-dehydratase n=1 Tax=Nitrosopumilus maritimus (strain SCM1) TaxID=436308 RepID=A9A1Q4_NITMS|nr:dTDP-glucose 4,6-dehydratase [Nitrosopumilus maritimus]ABX12025.1 dTDP-glucose 4,6-dehydratase [Nitrosopumilus maritimus SCM1]
MKILVTGGLGFIGSNFIINYLNEFPEHTIINLDNENHGANHQNLISIQKKNNYEFVKGDITNHKLMKNLISISDAIVNFAAESHVDRSISDATPFINSNILGVFTILEILKKEKEKRLVQISTDEVFGSLKKNSANENFKLNPSSPYSSSKASAELLVNSYFVTYEIDTVITRCTNNYGPRQFPEKLIPKTILLAMQKQKIPIYGNGKNIRDWIHVDDHCNAVKEVLHKGKSGESYNISAQNELDNIQIVTNILEKMGLNDDYLEFVEDRPGHDFRYSLDSSKIRNELKWKEETSFEDGIEKTIDWYVKNQEWCNGINKEILKKAKWNN